MRHYPRNSPQAAARIVVLAMVADGHVSKVELDVLDRHHACQRLGIDRSELQRVVQDFCEDLLSAAHQTWSQACQIDPHTLAGLMAEVDDPALRLRVLGLCLQVVDADEHMAEGESVALEAIVEHWGLEQEMFDHFAVSAASA